MTMFLDIEYPIRCAIDFAMGLQTCASFSAAHIFIGRSPHNPFLHSHYQFLEELNWFPTSLIHRVVGYING